MLRQPNDVHIVKSTLIDVARDNHIHYGSKQTALSILESRVAVGAFHNSSERFDPPKCHPRTRMAVLAKIRDWYLSKGETATRIMWLYGPAGAGKSAIAQTMAEECHALHTLAASFFFSRTAPDRNDATRFVATIAYQIACGIPDTRIYIEQALDNDPMILSKSLETQIYHLVTRPLLDTIANDSASAVSWPKLIIIDGLDECNVGETQQAIVRCLFSIVTQHAIPLRILISSRPEQPIRETFSRSEQRGSYVSLVLDNDYQSDKDIELFLEEEFTEIRDTHILKSYIPEIWPLHEHIRALVKKSSGQFIFASTVIRYVGSSRHRPTDRLQDILGIGTRGDATPFAELDALYMRVLESTDETQHATILRIFGFLLYRSKTPNYYINQPGNLEEYLNLLPGSIFLALADCPSIVDPFPYWGVRFLHASLSDFLTDSARSGKFFVDQGLIHAELAQACMKGVSSSNECVRAYSISSLPDHAEKARMNKALLEKLIHFDLTELLALDEDVPLRHYQVQPYQTCWKLISYVREQVHTGLYGDSKALLRGYLATLDHHLRLKLDAFIWPDRVGELFALYEKLQPDPYRHQDAWEVLGHLLHLRVDDPYLEAMRHLFRHEQPETSAAKMLYLDFLHDEKRAGKMYITGEIYALVAIQCIKNICWAYDGDYILCCNHRICNYGLKVLPSILSSADPLPELAEHLRLEKCAWSIEISVVRVEYLKRYGEWVEQRFVKEQGVVAGCVKGRMKETDLTAPFLLPTQSHLPWNRPLAPMSTLLRHAPTPTIPRIPSKAPVPPRIIRIHPAIYTLGNSTKP